MATTEPTGVRRRGGAGVGTPAGSKDSGAAVTDIPIYVINLAGSATRLAHARDELAAEGLAWTRVSAVDAHELGAAALAGVFDERRS